MSYDEPTTEPPSEEAFIETMDALQLGLAELLHDTSSQSINAARIYARVARNALRSAGSEAGPVLETLERAIEKAADELQELSRWLRPARLDTKDLNGELRELAALTARRAPCVFRSSSSTISSGSEGHAALLRVAQLAMLAIVCRKYPSVVELELEGRTLLLEIRITSTNPLPAELGLVLDAHARRVGGSCAQLVNELGTVLRCRVPTR